MSLDETVFPLGQSGDTKRRRSNPLRAAFFCAHGSFCLGDVVLDFAAGAGTFPVAALEEGRQFIGVELNDDVRAIKADSAITDLCRATCAEVRRLDDKRAEYRVDCVAFAKGRALESWQALPPEKRTTGCRMRLIAAAWTPV